MIASLCSQLLKLVHPDEFLRQTDNDYDRIDCSFAWHVVFENQDIVTEIHQTDQDHTLTVVTS